MSALWMVVAAFLFSVMGACVKWASRHYGVAEIMLYRSLIGVAILYAFVLRRGVTLATPLAKKHLQRGVSGTIALGLWFYATKILPLGTAMTLNYASSLYIASAIVIISVIQRKEVDVKL